MANEQAKPLASSSSIDDNKKPRRKRIKYCCGCMTVSLLLLIIVIIILAFTVFKVKDPKITLNQITITDLDLSLNAAQLQVRLNMSLVADLSIKNPNAVSFKFGNTTTTVYYHGTAVAMALGPPGRVKAHGTVQMNLAMDVMADRLVSSSGFLSEVIAGKINMTTYSIVPGRANVWNIVKKHVEVKMNCSMTIDISSRSIEDMSCKRKVKI